MSTPLAASSAQFITRAMLFSILRLRDAALHSDVAHVFFSNCVQLEQHAFAQQH
jgi:hypothetical protein